METRRIWAILVFVLASMANGEQYLTIDGNEVDTITLGAGEICTLGVASTDSNSYADIVGFDDALVLGAFSHVETNPAAGSLAGAMEYSDPNFYGYYIMAGGVSPRPSAGVHFVFEYEAQETGETDLRLYDELFTLVDSIHITVVPAPMGTAFTYQGHLMDSNNPADGQYDLQFRLYHTAVGATPKGSAISINEVEVIDGRFTLNLDFGGDVFAGDDLWLEIGVRPGELSDPDAYTTLSPRQEITPTPYALHTYGLSVVANNNTFVGEDAGASNTTGKGNTFSGRWAGYNNTTGLYNTFSGFLAGYSNTTGHDNTFSGEGAGYSNTTGSTNTFLGAEAGVFNTTGLRNIFLGAEAGGYNTTGRGNTFSGYGAGKDNTTGNYNTFSGYAAGYSNTEGSQNVFVGFQAGYYETGSNKLYIANGDPDSSVLIYGDFSTGRVGIGTKTLNYRLQLPNTADAGGQGQAYAWVNYSSRRWKTNIETIDNALEKVERLRGVYFDWKSNGKHDIGLIAEEVAEIIPQVVGYEEDGTDASSLDYARLVALLVEAIKQQQQKITELEQALVQNQSLVQRIETLEAKLGQYQFTVAKEVQQ